MESQAVGCGWSNKGSGFTLIEVLIALAILAISLTAIVKATGSDIDGNIRLKQATIANWVASNGVNLIQAGVLNFDRSGQPLDQVTTMLKEKWYWRAELANTPQNNIKKIRVSVRKKRGGPIIKRLDAFLIVRPEP